MLAKSHTGCDKHHRQEGTSMLHEYLLSDPKKGELPQQMANK